MSLEQSKYSHREDKDNKEKPKIIKMRIPYADSKLNDWWATPATVFDAAKIASSNLKGRFAFSSVPSFRDVAGWVHEAPYPMVSNSIIQNSVEYIINTEILSPLSVRNTDQDGRLTGIEIRQMKNESETDKRFAQLEEIVSSIAQKVDSIASKVEIISQKEINIQNESINRSFDIEKEIDNILKEKNYLKINELLNQNKERVIDILDIIGNNFIKH